MLKDLYTSYNTNFENSWNLITIGNSLYFTTSDRLSPSTTILWKLTPENFLVNSYTLVNAVSDSDIKRLKNYDTIYTDQNINIRADVYGTVGSVKFYVNNNPYSLESSSPYALAGDNNGNYREWTKPLGDITITAVPYSNIGASGTAGTPFILHLKIISPQDTIKTYISFTLVNALTEEDVLALTDGQTINLASLPTNKLNIRVNSTFPGTESISFDWQSTNNFRIENTEPYALFGDNSGDYNQWYALEGNFALTATPSTGNNASGTQGPSNTIHFSIINDPAQKIAAYPNPSENEIEIDLDGPYSESYNIAVIDLNGKLYYNNQLPANTKIFKLNFEELQMPPGVYFIKLQNSQTNEFIKITKNQ